MILSCVVIFNSSTPQTRKEDVVEDLQVQGQGLAITNFLFCMVWTFAYPAYIKFPGQEMPDFYPVFTLFNAWMGLVIFIFLGLSSKRFRFVLSRWRKKCGVSVIPYTISYRVSQKNALSWFFGNNSTLERARNKSRGCFENFRKFSM